MVTRLRVRERSVEGTGTLLRRVRLIKRLFPYLGPYRGRFVLLIVLTALAAAVGLLQPWPLAFLIDSVVQRASAFPGFLHFAQDWGATGQILFAVLLGFGFVLFQQGLSVFTRFIDTRLELGLVLDLRSELFQHIQRQSFQYHEQGLSSRYIYLVNNLAHEAGAALTGLIPLGEAVLSLCGMFVIVYLLDPGLAVAAATVIPVAYLTTAYYARVIDPKLIAVRQLEGESLQIVHERLSIIRVVQSFCREQYEHMRFRRQAERALDVRVRITILQAIFAMVVALLMAAGIALVLFVGARAAVRREITVGQLTVVVAYVHSAYKPLEQIANTLTAMQQQMIQVEACFHMLDAEPEVQEKPDAIELREASGHIDFQDVSFRYNTRERTLTEINLSIEPGEFVGIVGATGAGKSTLVSLVSRFADPQQGRVLVDGHDVRDFTLASLRGSISVVMQEPMLFIDTIMENIRYGRLEASDEEVMAAARAANCHDFITALPEGYQTMLGERGALVSGGERQRIAVARAFLMGAPILILDEPTSAVDSGTESVILDALDRLAQGRTTIMIAHRLSTIRRADRIVVMDEGRIVEVDSHDQLLHGGGPYARLWRAQTGQGRAESQRAAQAAVSALPSGRPEVIAELTDATEDTSAEPANPAGAARPAAPSSATLLVTAGIPRRPKVVLLGMMSKIPVAGVVWQTVQYLVGLERLGMEAYYVESHARTPSMFMEREDDDGSTKAAGFIADVMHRFGFDGRWAFHALHDDGGVHGMSIDALRCLYAEADLIINLHGGTQPLPEHSASGRLVYIETDPVQLQIELFNKEQATVDFLEPHAAFFTFGENYGRPDCGLPVSDRFGFLPTRQPIVRDFWEPYGQGPARSFTTVGNWRQEWREVTFEGETYQWSKHVEFMKVIDLPGRVPQRFELALSNYSPEDRRMLEGHGWHVVNALDVSLNLDSYRGYIGASRGEFTVAKDQNVRLRSGWFSDRSAAYLATGRPVVTQDTGFASALPTGEGLFGFSSTDDIVAAISQINGDYERHRRAARAIARDYFDHAVVLRPVLSECGIAVARPRRAPAGGSRTCLSPDLDLSVVRRHPTTLRPETVSAVLSAPLPEPADWVPAPAPAVSIVVVTHDNLVFTRLCLESVIVNTGRPDLELIVVDNASTDMTVAYLEELAARWTHFRVLRNDENLGFARATNQGLRAARGEVLVLLNNDTIVGRGWLDHLERHLTDESVGMVGPLTNRAPTEAHVEAPYSTYGGFLGFAAEHARSADQSAFEVNVLTMFCAALRRSTFERLGPLDERFETGMFEDDDYALRVRAAGLRNVVAQDVVVHHFGEASLGKLVATGEYRRIFDINKGRFERKWGVSWEAHRSRPAAGYRKLVDDVRAAISAAVPEGGTVLVVSKGDDELLDVPGRTLWHFPRDRAGGYSGWYPGDTEEVMEQLTELRARGAAFLVFPETAAWWFEFYDGLRDALGKHFEEVDASMACRIFAVRQRVGRPRMQVQA